jgi:protoporphyrinogen oxidase
MTAVLTGMSASSTGPDAPPVIIGAGPAGLTAARELVQGGVAPVVLDPDSRVGGLARTAEYRGFRFDIGGHRFFTKVAFEYPRHGPGLMWEAFRRQIQNAGGEVQLGQLVVVALEHDGGRLTAVVTENGAWRSRVPAGHVISSMPVRDLVRVLTPSPPPEVRQAAERLKYRGCRTSRTGPRDGAGPVADLPRTRVLLLGG